MNTESFVVAVGLLLASLFVTNLLVIRSLFLSLLDAVDRMQDGMSKLAQLGLIHVASKTPMQAVEATAALENELAALESAEKAMEKQILEAKEKPHGRLVGFRGPNGAVVRFVTEPKPAVVAKIPSDRLVYEQ